MPPIWGKSLNFALQTKGERPPDGCRNLIFSVMNIFTFAANVQQSFTNHFKEISGYQSFTTFASDLAIADCYGEKAVRDTFKSVTKNWLNDYKYYTEFIMALNFLCWAFYYNGNEGKSRLYAELFEKARDKAYRHFAKDSEATEYIYNTLD